MKKICVVTATRAEYGLLRRIIQHILSDEELELILAVTGTHLSKEYGYTIQEIEADGFPIAEAIDIFEGNASETEICSTMGKAAKLFGAFYERQKPDMLLVEGDRYELLPICSSAMIFGIPIAHISGGEVTEGAIDDSVRHCITKMSYLHFPGCEEYRRRIIQLGEAPERVFNFGDVGVENVRKMEYLSKKELEEFLKISLDKPFACVTFHPVTLEKDSAARQVRELIRAMEDFPELNFIVTMTNADLHGDVVNRLMKEASRKNDNMFCYTSLGISRYLSLMKYAKFILGNSSSGIVEAPCFEIPTVNIGDRQKGRLKAESVLDCSPEAEAIAACIKKALSEEFRRKLQNVRNPYGDGETSLLIVEKIKETLSQEGIVLKKGFFDMEEKK